MAWREAALVFVRQMEPADLPEVRALTNPAFGARNQALAQDARFPLLAARGYRAGRVMVRMKAGQNPDYDGSPGYYIDNWL